MRSEVLRIVTGIRYQPAAIPTANGNVVRSKMPLFREMIEPVSVATSTYIAPGSSCSPVSGLGAKDATVLLKSVSLRNAQLRKRLKLVSAEREWW